MGWVIIHKYHFPLSDPPTYDAVGPFPTEEEAIAFRDKYLPGRPIAPCSSPQEVVEHLEKRL